MTQLIFVKLSGSNQIRFKRLIRIPQVDLNFAAASTTERMQSHILIQLQDGAVGSSSTYIKHQGKFRFQVLANTLEEPFVTINLTIISLFQRKDEVDSSTTKVVSVQSKVPSTNLK
jgi:hypothetical protein